MGLEGKRPKLLMISYLDYPSFTGLSRRIDGLSSVLDASGIDVHVLCPKCRYPYGKGHARNIVSFDLRRLCGANYDRIPSKSLRLLLFTIFALKYIMQHRTDFKVIQYESVFSSVPAIVVKFLTKALIVGDDLKLSEGTRGRFLDALARPFETILLRLTDVLITSSPTTFRLLKRSTCQRRLYIPNGVQFPPSSEAHGAIMSPKKCVAIFVGALSYAENRAAIAQLLRLPADMGDDAQNLLIWIIGGPLTDLRETFDDEIVERGFIKFWESVDEETLSRIYASAQIGLLPFFEAMHEVGGQRIKALEYFAHGLIVLSTSAGIRGITGLIDGVHFIRVASRGEMAEALKKIIRSPEQYHEIAFRGKTQIAASFDWNVVSREYVEFLSTLSADGENQTISGRSCALRSPYDLDAKARNYVTSWRASVTAYASLTSRDLPK